MSSTIEPTDEEIIERLGEAEKAEVELTALIRPLLSRYSPGTLVFALTGLLRTVELSLVAQSLDEDSVVKATDAALQLQRQYNTLDMRLRTDGEA